MSEAMGGRFDSINWTEEEVNELMVWKVPLDHPEIQERMARLPQDKKDLVVSRHHPIDRIVWRKFMRTLGNRDLLYDFFDTVAIPHTLPTRKAGYTSATVVYLEEKAPDLVDDFLAHQEFKTVRAIEWADAQELRRNGPH